MKEQEEGLEKEAEIQRLKAQRDHLVEKQQQLQQLVQRHNLYGDFLEEVVKMTKVLQVGYIHIFIWLVHIETLSKETLYWRSLKNVVNILPPKH